MNLNQLFLIIKLGRLHFLVAGFLTYLIGVLLAVTLFNVFSWDRFILGYAVLLPAHLMVNYSNEYFDMEVDQYSSPSQFSGGTGVLIKHPELKNFTLYFSISMMAISLTLGLIFSYFYNSLVFLILTVAGNLLGWFYTAPPLKLSYRGWGELATIFSGFLIPGLGFAAISGVINYQFLIFSVPIMLFYVLFILSVEVPDRNADKIGGKNTFLVRFGLTSALVLMVVASSLATISFLVIPRDLFYPLNLNILALLSIIPLISAILTLVYRGSSLNKSVSRNVNALVLFVVNVNVYIFII